MIRTWSFAIAVGVVLATALAPAIGSAQDREWVEDYTDEWADSDRGYDVSVDELDGEGDVSIDTFQEPLSAHGDWVASSYGRVWRPHVAAGWRPYYYGHWEWTNEGWFWVSDEPWGWAAYHYGRWALEPAFGWIWVPGFQWAPAWVSWRYSGDVIGWAPLAPGFSIYFTNYPFYDHYWTFVPTVRFVGVPVYSVAYGPSYTHRYYRSTAPAPPPRSARPAPIPGGRSAPAPAWGGPAPRVIEQRTGRRVTPARVVPAASPNARGRAGEIPVYRPEVRPGPRPGGVAGADLGRGRGRGTDAASPPGQRGSMRAPAGRGGRDSAPSQSFTEPRGGRRESTPGWTGGTRSEGAAPRGGTAPRGEPRAAPRGESRAEPAPRAERPSGEGRAAPRQERRDDRAAPSRGGSGGSSWSAPPRQSPSAPPRSSTPPRSSGASGGGRDDRAPRR
jgi:hypothetical protein